MKMKGRLMNGYGDHDLGVVFSNLEIVDLCNSLRDVHLALNALGRIIKGLDDPVLQKSNSFYSALQGRCVTAVAEQLLVDQHRALSRILSIYEVEKKRLYGGSNL
jgi:hypothetical protein